MPDEMHRFGRRLKMQDEHSNKRIGKGKRRVRILRFDEVKNLNKTNKHLVWVPRVDTSGSRMAAVLERIYYMSRSIRSRTGAALCSL